MKVITVDPGAPRLRCGCLVGGCDCDVSCSCKWRRNHGGSQRGGFRRMVDVDCPIHGPDPKWYPMSRERKTEDAR